ncbi:MAG: hypothetical protein ACR2O1_04530 [Boseongicola sp.]
MQKRVKLSRLRDIGWSLWDPIGLLSKGDTWEDKSYADEYDAYLLQAAGRLRRDTPVGEVVDYLVWVETEHMGLDKHSGQIERIEAVVTAIEADDQLWAH